MMSGYFYKNDFLFFEIYQEYVRFLDVSFFIVALFKFFIFFSPHKTGLFLFIVST